MTLVCKDIGQYFQIILIGALSIVNTIERTYVYSIGINKHVISMTITKEGKIQFLIHFLLMLHCRFAKVTYNLLCESIR